MSNNTNDYLIHPFEIIHHSSNDSTYFEIRMTFERNSKGILDVLVNYHMICGMLVLLASVGFLIDPKDTNRANLLVVLLLVLASMLNVGQVNYTKKVRINSH